MEALVWSDRFLVGVESIDAQHRRLFDLANRVGALLIDPAAADAAAIDGVFHELADYAATHFRDEEQLMREAGVAARYFEHHAQAHRDFADQLAAMWAVRRYLSAPAETLHSFVVAWLTYHILGEDQAMARIIMRQKGGMSAEQALQAEPGRGERSSDALLQALRRLYGNLSQLNRDLVAANRGLEEKVTQRTRELLQSEKMASIGQLAAGIAHEINNPVGFVNSNLTTLEHYILDLLHLAELGAVTPAGQTLSKQIDFEFLKGDLGELLRESLGGLERVRRIVADLKDFSRVGQAEWQEADLLAGLESTLNVAAHELKYKADIVRELQPLPPVRCVPAQINQVLLNLLVNAAQAIETRGTITLRSGTDGGFVWLEIADSGRGMDEATQRRMFEPFFTTKPVGIGTGLGLALSYDIVVARHGGCIEVDSAPGRGTRMRIRLPITGPAAAS